MCNGIGHIKFNKEKYIKHLESELMAKNQTIKAYKEKYHDALIENEQLRSEIQTLRLRQKRLNSFDWS